MNRYECLFILNTAGHEDSIQEIIDKIGKDIAELGGKVESIQKMDKRGFARVASKKHQEGFYVNVIFEAETGLNDELQLKYRLDDTVYRLLVTQIPAEAAA